MVFINVGESIAFTDVGETMVVFINVGQMMVFTNVGETLLFS